MKNNLTLTPDATMNENLTLSQNGDIAGTTLVKILNAHVIENGAVISSGQPFRTETGNWVVSFHVRIDAENSIEFSAVQTGFSGPMFAE